MPPRSNRKRYNQTAYQARMREVRDLNDKLRTRFVAWRVEKFFLENYFIQPGTIDYYVRLSDHQEVDITTASIIYRTAMQPDFNLPATQSDFNSQI